VTAPRADAPKPRGRPRAVDRGETVSTYIRTSDYDKLLRLATDQRKSLSGLVRDLLRLKL
jgi:hypothetical protein